MEVKSLRLVSRGEKQVVDRSIWGLKPRVMRLEEVSCISLEKTLKNKQAEIKQCHTHIASKLVERSSALSTFIHLEEVS